MVFYRRRGVGWGSGERWRVSTARSGRASLSEAAQASDARRTVDTLLNETLALSVEAALQPTPPGEGAFSVRSSQREQAVGVSKERPPYLL